MNGIIYDFHEDLDLNVEQKEIPKRRLLLERLYCVWGTCQIEPEIQIKCIWKQPEAVGVSGYGKVSLSQGLMQETSCFVCAQIQPLWRWNMFVGTSVTRSVNLWSMPRRPRQPGSYLRSSGWCRIVRWMLFLPFWLCLAVPKLQGSETVNPLENP